MLKTTPIAGALGAVIHDVDLRPPITDELFAELRAALLEHQVVILRGQSLTDEEHQALGRRFGPLSIHPVSAASGTNETMEWIEDGPESPPKATRWHADLAWLPAPPKIGLLSAQELPSVGGDTQWMSLRAAYQSISKPLQDRLEGLVVVHDAGDNFFAQVEIAAGKTIADELRKLVEQSAEHPLVVTHPETGEKTLCFSPPNATRIVGLHPEESRMLLGFLRDLVDRPELSMRWKWEVNDLAIWDERYTLHRGLPDHYPARRVMRRCTVDPEPAARAA
jgi:taurine dioxygenase